MPDIKLDPEKNTNEFMKKVIDILRSRYGYTDVMAVEQIVLEFLKIERKHGHSILEYLREVTGVPKESED